MMMRRLVMTAGTIAVLMMIPPSRARAQESQPATTPAPPTTAPPPKAITRAPMMPPPVGVVAGTGPNVRVEVTLTDQQSGVPPASKTVMVTTSNFQWGRVRSEVESRAYGVAPLNIDVQPEVMADGRIALRLTIEYSQGRMSEAEGNTEHISKVKLNESLAIIVPNGQS